MTRIPIRWPDGRLLSRDDRALVMGIVNVTPDSFSDGGRFDSHDKAIAQAERLIEEGADIIDIGGESSRPGHTPLPADEEMARVLPVIEALAARTRVPISIDSWKAEVADAACRAGATIVNDVWGFQRDPGIAAVARKHGALAILMHNRDIFDPAVDMVAEVRQFLERSLALADAAGIAREHVILDPGIGFGKDFKQNVALIRALPQLKAFGCALLMGLSRKAMIGRILDEPDTDKRLFGTVAANLVSVQAGAEIVRVHDVKPHVDALKVLAALEGAP